MPNSSAFFQGKINPHFYKICANQSDSANDNDISAFEILQLHWSGIFFQDKPEAKASVSETHQYCGLKPTPQLGTLKN